MKIRIVLTLLFITAMVILAFTYHSFEGQIEGNAAVNQLENCDYTYAVSKRVIVNKVGLFLGYITFGFLIVLTWLTYLVPFSLRRNS